MHAGRRPLQWRSATRLLTAAAAGALLGFAAADAGAQSGKGDYIPSWSVSGAIGVAVPNTDEYENSLDWRLGVGYSPTPQFEFVLESGRFATTVSHLDANGVPSYTIASGRLAVVPVCISAHYRKPLADVLSTLNLLVGVGYYFIDYAMADTPAGVFRSGGVQGLPDQIVENAWGFHFGAGLEYALTERYSLTGDARYLFLAPQISGTASPGRRIEGSLDLNTWLFTGGVKVAF